MTTMQKTVVTALVVGAVGFGVYQARQVSTLRDQVQVLKKQEVDQAALNSQVEALQQERDHATNALTALQAENATLRQRPSEVLKLRGEVGRLQHENLSMGSSSALSKVTANAEARNMLRSTQKMAMGMVYKGLTKQLKLSTEQADQLNDLLADHVMTNVDHITTILRDKIPLDQMNQIFAGENSALDAQLQTLLGPDGLAQYQDYTKNLLSTLTADQFKGMMTGSAAEKDQKAAQLRQLLQQETQAALAKAGLPADYQTVPTLNFANIASEQVGDQSLKLLDDIYQNAAAHAASFLTPDDLAKFQEFRTTALNNNRAALSMNRMMMAPISN